MNKNVKNLAYFGLGAAYTVVKKVHDLSTKAIDKSQKITKIGEGAAKDNLKKINEIKSIGMEKSSLLKGKLFGENIRNRIHTEQILEKINKVDKTLSEHIEKEKRSISAE